MRGRVPGTRHYARQGGRVVAVAAYEAAMFPRSKISAEASARGLDMCFATDAPREMVNFFADMEAPGTLNRRNRDASSLAGWFSESPRHL